MRKQEARESAEIFIRNLHQITDTCKYGALKDDLTRDKIAVGLLDKI